MTELQLSAEQAVEAPGLFQRLQSAFERAALQLARVMASKEDGQVLGRTEFEVRDQVHRLGAQVLEAVRQERKKRLPGRNDRLSLLPSGGAVRRLSGEEREEVRGSATSGAPLLSLRDVWAGVLSLG
jgi:hypothetical protein